MKGKQMSNTERATYWFDTRHSSQYWAIGIERLTKLEWAVYGRPYGGNGDIKRIDTAISINKSAAIRYIRKVWGV